MLTKDLLFSFIVGRGFNRDVTDAARSPTLLPQAPSPFPARTRDACAVPVEASSPDIEIAA